jgi:hypothetical protein
MTDLATVPIRPAVLPELWTLIAISCLAYVLGVALHEHGGHTAACLLLGSQPTEMGAFYVNCDNARLSALAIRLVALAGPVVSLIVGVVGFAILAMQRGGAPATAYFFWLLGTVGLMSAAGYPLFSGVTGMGDLGFSSDSAFFGASPEWPWRAALTLSGVLGYLGVVYFSLMRLEPLLSGSGRARLTVPRRAALVSYFVGAATYLIIGAFNPYGWQIILVSVLPSSMGGTSGLLWMFQLADRNRNSSGPGLFFERRWSYITVGLLVVLGYGLVFARTLRWQHG